MRQAMISILIVAGTVVSQAQESPLPAVTNSWANLKVLPFRDLLQPFEIKFSDALKKHS